MAFFTQSLPFASGFGLPGAFGSFTPGLGSLGSLASDRLMGMDPMANPAAMMMGNPMMNPMAMMNPMGGMDPMGGQEMMMMQALMGELLGLLTSLMQQQAQNTGNLGGSSPTDLSGGSSGGSSDAGSSGGSSGGGGGSVSDASGGGGGSDNFNSYSSGTASASQFQGGTAAGRTLAAAAENEANHENTHGWCFRGVSRALHSIGVNTSGAAAWMAADELAHNPKVKEIQVPRSELSHLPPGAIVVWDKRPGIPYGHISVSLGNGREASDHVAAQAVNMNGDSYRVFMPI